eukprot:Hpha_TRINITY_DN14196_c0_g2::TRINITY_DN14196_c0_g2_i1::g.10656::m.10656
MSPPPSLPPCGSFTHPTRKSPTRTKGAAELTSAPPISKNCVGSVSPTRPAWGRRPAPPPVRPVISSPHSCARKRSGTETGEGWVEPEATTTTPVPAGGAEGVVGEKAVPSHSHKSHRRSHSHVPRRQASESPSSIPQSCFGRTWPERGARSGRFRPQDREPKDESPDPRAVEVFKSAYKELGMFTYNRDGFVYSIDKRRSVSELIQQGAAIIRNREVFGRIQCVEAAFAGILLTQECFNLTRFGISFETSAGEKNHRHLVLGVLCGDCFGSLGISRGRGLGSKPLKHPTLLALLQDYRAWYREEGHELTAVVLGRPVPHLMTCGRVCWSYVRLKVREADTTFAEGCNRYEQFLRAVASAAQQTADSGGLQKVGPSGFSNSRHSFPPVRHLLPLSPQTDSSGSESKPRVESGFSLRGRFAPLRLQRLSEAETSIRAHAALMLCGAMAAVAAADAVPVPARSVQPSRTKR